VSSQSEFWLRSPMHFLTARSPKYRVFDKSV
jgi:hypothetical protein